MNVRPMRAALRSSINGSKARGGSDLGGVGPTGLKWVIQYTPSVIYIYINMDLEYRHLEKYGIIWFVYGL